MKSQRFAIHYTPAKHDGKDNTSNRSFFYYVQVDGEAFNNGRNTVGFVGINEADNSIKRFRWDRLRSIVALD